MRLISRRATGKRMGRRALRQLRPLCRDRAGSVVVLISASILAGLAEAAVLALVANVAAAMVVRAGDLGAALGPIGLRMSLGLALVVALALAVARLLLQLVIAWLPAHISAQVQARLRSDVFDAFAHASWAVQAQDHEGHLQELMTDQVNQVTQVISQLAGALSGGAMFLALVVAAFVLNAVVAAIVLVTAVAIFWVLRPIALLGGRAGRDLSQANMDHAAGVSEAVRLAEDAHVYGVVHAEEEHIEGLIQLVRAAFFRYQLMGGLSRGLYQSLVIMLIVVGLTGLYVAHAGDLAALGAVVLMLVRSASYAQQFQGGYQVLLQVLPYLERLDAATSRYRAGAAPVGRRSLDQLHTIGLQGVSYAYGPGRPALADVTIKVDQGEAIGILGPSGAGKSTLVQVLLRLREPDGGSYLINGLPASEYRRDDWSRRVAYVAQEPRLMRATVAENIRFWRALDRNAVERAARLAHIHEDILRLPNGYDTEIGQVADALSGGQRQRICLARALVGHPDVLILDEPTSALDVASEMGVQQTLLDLHGSVTIFVVSHRMSAISVCDRGLVLVDGAVEAFAPIAELSSVSSFYEGATTPIGAGSALDAGWATR